MRRFFALIIGGIIVIFIASEIFLPRFLGEALEDKLAESMHTKDVEVSLSSLPAFLLLTGRIDHLDARAKDGRMGEMVSDSLILTGEDVHLDLPLLAREGKLRLLSAKELKLVGNFSEGNLSDFIKRKVDRLEDLKVKISPQGISATADAKIFGRKANVTLEGVIVATEGSLYFRATKAHVENAFPGSIDLERFFGDIKIISGKELPLGAGFTDVAFEEGNVTVTAEGQNLLETP